MKKVLIVFGSSSDSPVYDQIAKNLPEGDPRVASAHREPELVERILGEGHNVIIAGAGLAAHLPGVVASKTFRPVIGVPVNSNFGGVDSLLSIMQMPGGIPVLSVGVNATQEAARNAALMLEQREYVNIMGNASHERAKKCISILEKFNVNFEISKEPSDVAVNINFTPFSNPDVPDKDLVINVPLASSHAPEEVPKLLELTQKGLWVGLNRGENAAIAAIEILNLDGRYSAQLEDFRKSLKQPVEEKKLTYKDAGVDIDAAEKSNALIKELVKQTYNHNTLSELGSFGGLYRFNKNQYENPVLVSSTDGVGTKLKLAVKTGIHTTVGTDLVHHCINDILVQGASPLFFLDYIGTGKLNPKTSEDIMKGFTLGCVANSTVLIGGETAELPGIYKGNEYDLVGTIIGVVEKEKIITGETIVPGDVVIGLASNGIHTNGYSLATKVLLDVAGYKLNDKPEGMSITLKEALMKTHTCYYKPVKALLKKFNIKGMAHITGGGIPGNLPRILPKEVSAEIDKSAWEVPQLFKLIQDKGNVPEDDMYRTFNMGIGFCIVVPKNQADEVLQRIDGFNVQAFKVGSIVEGEQEVRFKQSAGFLNKLFKKKEEESSPQAVKQHAQQLASQRQVSVRAAEEPEEETADTEEESQEEPEEEQETTSPPVEQKGDTMQQDQAKQSSPQASASSDPLEGAQALDGTNFPNLGEKYQGKVRDTYRKDDKLTLIATDRISAFDRVLGTIPLRGQILNQMALFWFDQTKDIISNHIIDTPDPNVVVAQRCNPFPVEVIVRRYLTGSLWRQYEKGDRGMYGLHFPEGLKKYHKFETPILTPTTKAQEGHDMPITRDEILQQGLLTKEQLEATERVALHLFARGEKVATERGLVLVDTKYEFGTNEEGQIILIDEVHTPDSSRYWYLDSLKGIEQGQDPKEMNKEYVRQWLIGQGWQGDGEQPPLTDEVKRNALQRYIDTFEQLTGKKFVPEKGNVKERIEQNLKSKGYL